MENVVKVKAIQNFTDSKEEVYRKVGDEFECTEERANQLVNFIMAEKPYPLVEVLEIVAKDLLDQLNDSLKKALEEELKESIIIVPDDEESKEDKKEAEAPKAKNNKRNTKANKAE